MKTVLFAWELGGGFGHIASLRRYAGRLAGHGIRMVAAVRNLKAASVLADLGVEIRQAPPWPEASFTTKEYTVTSSATLGDSLASAGLADENALSDVLARWSKILRSVNPDLVVADYAPAAGLLARGRVPLMLVGNGYTLPPSDMTRFPLMHRMLPPAWDEMRLLTIVNKTGSAFGIKPLEQLPQLFSADDYLVETFPLLDPYDLQRTTPVDGPAFDQTPLARSKDADTILVYLASGYVIHNDIVSALLPVAGRAEIYAPGLSFVQQSRLKLAGARVHPEQISLAEALTSAKLAIHFGGSGLAAHAMAAGLPQLIFSTHIEQELNGLALERAGIGKLARSHDPDTAISSSTISSLLEDTALADRATQSGATYRGMLREYDPLAVFEARSLKLLQR